VEEVHRAAVDDARELRGALTHRVADRTHADDHLEILADLEDELLEEVVVGFVGLAFGLSLVLEQSRLRDVFGLSHELGDVAGVEEVVDADEELLLDDLAVGDDEGHGFAGLDRTLLEERFDVLLEAGVVVVALDHDLEEQDFVQEDCEFGQRLLAGAADAQQERVAARFLHDARDVADVFDRLAEEHDRHGRLAVVVLLEFVGQHVGQLQRLVPVLRFVRELAVADDLVDE